MKFGRRPPRSQAERRPRWPLVVVGGVSAAAAGLVTRLVRGDDSNFLVPVGLAAVAGVLIGLVAAFVVGRRDATIRRGSDLSKLTSVPNLAVIPRHPIGAQRPDDVVMFRDPNSIDAEAYRTLRTAFDFVTGASQASDESTPGTVVLVTSPRPGEGKSSVASNLAAAAAMAGRKVVVVDGDLRKPQLHRLFHLPNSTGLASLLTGNKKLADAVQRLDGTPNLMVMSAGPPPPDPAELLANDRLGATLEAFARYADLVIVDAPPLLAVTDPTIIAQHCDGVLMVATADVSTKREWVEALARLAVVEANVVGTVLLQPDDRVRTVPTYRYAPSAIPRDWWVAPAANPVSDEANAAWPKPSGVTAPADAQEAVSDGWPTPRRGG